MEMEEPHQIEGMEQDTLTVQETMQTHLLPLPTPYQQEQDMNS